LRTRIPPSQRLSSGGLSVLQRADPPFAFFLLDAMLSRASFSFTTAALGLIASLKAIESRVCRK
jgi:hypothetical protein